MISNISPMLSNTSLTPLNTSLTPLNTNINPNGYVGDINYISNPYPAYSTITVPDPTFINYNFK